MSKLRTVKNEREEAARRAWTWGPEGDGMTALGVLLLAISGNRTPFRASKREHTPALLPQIGEELK